MSFPTLALVEFAMASGEFFAVMFVIWLVFKIIGFFSDDNQVAQGISIRVEPGTVELEDAGSVDVYRVFLSGVVAVPSDDYLAKVVFMLTDITEDEPLPVVCFYDDLSDENGFYYKVEESNIPYQLSTFDNIEVHTIPRDALMLARRGVRKLKLDFAIADPDLSKEIWYAHANAIITQKQKTYGYCEIKERDIAVDRAVATLGLAVCACDMHIDKTETNVLQQHFKERITGVEDEAERKTRKETLNAVFKEELENAKARVKRKEVADYGTLCAAITAHESADLNHEAYELCVRIVGADGVVDEAEEQVLKIFASHLAIPSELDKEIRERHLRLSMYDFSRRSQAISIPTEATPEERRKHINREYEKWRRRVTSTEPAVKKEAEERLAMLAKMRRELDLSAADSNQ